MASGGRIESWNSKRCWYQGRPGRSKSLLQWARQSPPPVVTRPDPGDSPPPAPPVPPPTETVDITPKVVSTVPIPALTSKPPQMAAPLPSLPEPPPLPAKPTKPSKWWMLLLIIPAIATGLAAASQFQPARWTLFKNFRRRWTNWQTRLAGHLDLMGDNIARWSRRASRPVQIDPTSPRLEQTKRFADEIRSQVAGRELAGPIRLRRIRCPRWGIASGYVGRSVSALLTKRWQAQHRPFLQRHDLYGWRRRSRPCCRRLRNLRRALVHSRGLLGFARRQDLGELGRSIFGVPSGHLACRLPSRSTRAAPATRARRYMTRRA